MTISRRRQMPQEKQVRPVRLCADGTLFPDGSLVIWQEIDGRILAVDWSEYGYHVMCGTARVHGPADEQMPAREFFATLPADAEVEWLGAGYTPSGRLGGNFSRGRDTFTAAQVLQDITEVPSYPTGSFSESVDAVTVGGSPPGT
jgi:hypothetical protein